MFDQELAKEMHTMAHHDDDARLSDVLAALSDEGTKDLFRRLLEQSLQHG